MSYFCIKVRLFCEYLLLFRHIYKTAFYGLFISQACNKVLFARRDRLRVPQRRILQHNFAGKLT
ncbi:putative lipoprotein [Klebsiella oxytoca OK-1]|nr:putative lipoprotein [Klebsiella oxytoca OK-1]